MPVLKRSLTQHLISPKKGDERFYISHLPTGQKSAMMTGYVQKDTELFFKSHYVKHKLGLINTRPKLRSFIAINLQLSKESDQEDLTRLKSEYVLSKVTNW